MVSRWTALLGIAVVAAIGGSVGYLLLTARRVIVSPTSVPQGGSIQWTAINFPPNTEVTAATGVAIEAAITDATGKASGTLSTVGQVPFQGYQLIVNVTANPAIFGVAHYNVT